MPLIVQRVTIPLTSVNENILAGQTFEFMQRPGMIELGIVQIDGAAGDCFATIQSGSDVLCDRMPLNLRATGINIREDVILEDIAAAGDRLKVRVENTNAAARIVQLLCRITYLG